MPIGRDKPENPAPDTDPAIEAQMSLLADAATDPQDLLSEEADPVKAESGLEDTQPNRNDEPRN
ncbi:hypothetical protein IQ268_05535 [Oculatella sp. LEGE 06141]|uniref:hypothetical protein n=1 Tax=Oculatella sp. LEGE 06141 TaxID=1828648 RepID=UPI0018813A03|nr:hypothetical protein [Oculatella sp. LEGE 06141]MBE9178046.1 hypothetical protein [Oculatella sp. LEGE 06141]